MPTARDTPFALGRWPQRQLAARASHAGGGLPTAAPYWVLFAVVLATEWIRQRHADDLLTASAQDAILMLIFWLNRQKLGWRTLVAAVAAIAFATVHHLVLGLPLVVVVFGARYLVYIAATLDLLRGHEAAHRPSRRALWAGAVLTGALLAFAVVQLLTGFEYVNETYNAASMGEGTGSQHRLPSVFYNFATYAKFGLSAVIVAISALVAETGNRARRQALLAPVMCVVAAAVCGILLSGQRAALGMAVLVLGVAAIRLRAIRLAIGVALSFVLAILAIGALAPDYKDRALAAIGDAPGRIDNTVVRGVPAALNTVPLAWGLGMGACTAPAVRYDARAGTSWSKACDGTSYEGGEGILHYALVMGGLPWVAVTVLALSWGLFGRVGAVARSMALAYGAWSLTHVIWGSPQPYLLTSLLMLTLWSEPRAAAAAAGRRP